MLGAGGNSSIRLFSSPLLFPMCPPAVHPFDVDGVSQKKNVKNILFLFFAGCLLGTRWGILSSFFVLCARRVQVMWSNFIKNPFCNFGSHSSIPLMQESIQSNILRQYAKISGLKNPSYAKSYKTRSFLINIFVLPRSRVDRFGCALRC